MFLFCLGDIYSNRRGNKKPLHSFSLAAFSLSLPYLVYPLLFPLNITGVRYILLRVLGGLFSIWWDGLHYMSVKHKNKREHHCPDSHNTTRTNLPSHLISGHQPTDTLATSLCFDHLFLLTFHEQETQLALQKYTLPDQQPRKNIITSYVAYISPRTRPCPQYATSIPS